MIRRKMPFNKGSRINPRQVLLLPNKAGERGIFKKENNSYFTTIMWMILEKTKGKITMVRILFMLFGTHSRIENIDHAYRIQKDPVCKLKLHQYFSR